MRIGFFLENRDLEGVDLRLPQLGNPGCGGTEFLFVATAAALASVAEKFGNHNRMDPRITLYAQSSTLLPESLEVISTPRLDVIFDDDFPEKPDLLIFRPRRDRNSELMWRISASSIKCIAWIHVTPSDTHLRTLAQCDNISAVVCVEELQMQLLADSPCWSKLTFIRNLFDIDGWSDFKGPFAKTKNLVVYLGALVEAKGFHVLAEAWQFVIRKCPHAKLIVIGSDDLYGKSQTHNDQEKSVSPYLRNCINNFLTDRNGDLMKSVQFKGKMGIEKKQILHSALVGVINPTGQTENCPGAALEIQASSTFVVGGNYYGNLDTIADDRSGKLIKNHPKALAEVLIRALQDPDYAIQAGKAGPSFISTKYQPTKVVDDWLKLFHAVECGRTFAKPLRMKYVSRHFIYLVYINRLFQIIFGSILPWPTINELKIWCYRFVRKR